MRERNRVGDIKNPAGRGAVSYHRGVRGERTRTSWGTSSAAGRKQGMVTVARIVATAGTCGAPRGARHQRREVRSLRRLELARAFVELAGDHDVAKLVGIGPASSRSRSCSVGDHSYTD